MNINLETSETGSIQSYDNSQVKIDSTIYTSNLIVCKQGINPDWKIRSIIELDDIQVQSFLIYNPEVIILGHNQSGKFPPGPTLQLLSTQRIGLEAMSVGAACRTYNVLLNENRKVVLGLIF